MGLSYTKPKYTKVLNIENKKIGLIVGKKGNTIKLISKKFNIQIKINKKKSSILIIGMTEDIVNQAIKYIKNILLSSSKKKYKNDINIVENFSIEKIAKEVNWTIQDVINFAKETNITLGVINEKSILKEQQAKGLIAKIKKSFTSVLEVNKTNIIKVTKEYTIQEIAQEVNWTIQDVINFAKETNIPLGVITEKSILKEPQAKGLIAKIKKELQ